MSDLKTVCRECWQEVELWNTDVTLRVCTLPEHSYYSFFCPTCMHEVSKPADGHVVSLLMSVGVIAHTWDIPLEALEPHTGPALLYDDLLDFVLELGRDDMLSNRALTCVIKALHRRHARH